MANDDTARRAEIDAEMRANLEQLARNEDAWRAEQEEG